MFLNLETGKEYLNSNGNTTINRKINDWVTYEQR